MSRIAAVLIFALALTACSVIDDVKEAFKQANAIESDLEESTGVRPQVGFNWSNGQLVSVTVQYPQLVETKSLSDLAEAARAAIGREFKEAPGNLVLAFSVPR
jgi:hypothetical protein